MTEPRRLTPEDLLYAAAFVLALALRLLQLGALPLSDGEAAWAMQAFGVAQGGHPLIGAQPGYVNLTALSFFVFSAGNFLARFWPALLGAAVVLVPYFFRERLGLLAGLILSFGLAIDPGLVALSRTAGGSMFAVGTTLLAWAFWRSGNRPAAGIFAGLALLAGLPLWGGLLGLAIAWLIMQGIEGRQENGSRDFASLREKLEPALWPAVATVVLIGSLFFLAPNGLGGALQAVADYVRGWITPSGVPPLRLLLTLAAYEPIVIIFGGIALVRGVISRDSLQLRLGIWFAVALVLALAYPGRTPADLAWALVPLWALAAIELARYDHVEAQNLWETLGMVILTVAILTYAGMNVAGLAHLTDPQTTSQRLTLLGGALGLLAVCAFLVGLGWSASVARIGLAWGAAIMLALYTFSMMWSAAGLRPFPTFEMWTSDPPIKESGLLLQTLNELSEFNQGVNDSLPVAVIGVDSDALRWLLRDWKTDDQIDPASAAGSAPLVIATDDPSASFSASYRGQDFVWRVYPAWDTAAPIDLVSWLSTRQIAFGEEKIILWARADLFKDESPQTP